MCDFNKELKAYTFFISTLPLFQFLTNQEFYTVDMDKQDKYNQTHQAERHFLNHRRTNRNMFTQ